MSFFGEAMNRVRSTRENHSYGEEICWVTKGYRDFRVGTLDDAVHTVHHHSGIAAYEEALYPEAELWSVGK